MASVLNGLFLASAILFLTVTFIYSLRDPPPPEKLARWRLGPFWVSNRLRVASLLLFSVSAAAGIVCAVGSGVGADWGAATPWLLGLAAVLTSLAVASVVFSLALYWRPSAAKPYGF